jgi:hypothetical protein
MKSHRRYLRRLRTAVVLALCVPLSASAGALADPPAGDTKADYPGTTPAPKIGDTPADFAQPVAPAAKAGDTPADYPGASRAPEFEPPTTITVNRPERTIVRDVNDELPTILAGLALLIALGGAGFALIRTRSPQRGVVGRSH